MTFIEPAAQQECGVEMPSSKYTKPQRYIHHLSTVQRGDRLYRTDVTSVRYADSSVKVLALADFRSRDLETHRGWQLSGSSGHVMGPFASVGCSICLSGISLDLILCLRAMSWIRDNLFSISESRSGFKSIFPSKFSNSWEASERLIWAVSNKPFRLLEGKV